MTLVMIEYEFKMQWNQLAEAGGGNVRSIVTDAGLTSAFMSDYREH